MLARTKGSTARPTSTRAFRTPWTANVFGRIAAQRLSSLRPPTNGAAKRCHTSPARGSPASAAFPEDPEQLIELPIIVPRTGGSTKQQPNRTEYLPRHDPHLHDLRPLSSVEQTQAPGMPSLNRNIENSAPTLRSIWPAPHCEVFPMQALSLFGDIQKKARSGVKLLTAAAFIGQAAVINTNERLVCADRFPYLERAVLYSETRRRCTVSGAVTQREK